MFHLILSILLLTCVNLSHALSVTDDVGNIIKLDKPAQRVIALAPSLTEMIFSIDAQDKLVATVKSSNYPDAASQVPRVGDYQTFVMETLLSFQPDLILSWTSGNNPAQIQKLEKLNIPVYRSEPLQIKDIPRTIRNLGILLGHEQQAEAAALQFEQRLTKLKAQNKNKPRIKAFYQIWHAPMYTVNGEHVISKLMNICGLDNIFAQAKILAPKIDQEAVIARNPDIIIASGMATGKPEWLNIWKKWTSITAVKADNLFFVHPDLINRQSLRIMDGAEIICQQAEQARKNLKVKGK